MKVRTRRALYVGHSWAGVSFGLVIFVVCVTGTLATFRNEIRVWANPLLDRLDRVEARGTPPASLDDAVRAFGQQHDLKAKRFWAIRLPGDDSPAYELLYSTGGRSGLTRAYVDPNTAEYLGASRNQIADFLFQLHANLSFRSKVGRYVVGLAGVALLVLIVTGVLHHRHLIRSLFTMRWRASLRVVLSDTHKAMGTWALLFHLVMAFTGAFLGLKALLILVPTVAEYRGDVAAARRGLAGPRERPARTPATMASIDHMLAHSRAAAPGFLPTLVVAQSWGDARARVAISGSLPGHLLPKNEAVRVRFDAVTGAALSLESGLDHGVSRRIYDAVTPLHYGDFAGTWLKLVYFLLGISTATLTWTGIVMWIDRRDRDRR